MIQGQPHENEVEMKVRPGEEARVRRGRNYRRYRDEPVEDE
jgi:hypothetical protein